MTGASFAPLEGGCRGRAVRHRIESLPRWAAKILRVVFCCFSQRDLAGYRAALEADALRA